jgi:ribonuclease HII
MKRILGIDEAGRGPVLGNLFVAGVCVSEDQLKVLDTSEVNDSKQLSPQKRKILFDFILNNCLSYEICQITVEVIDRNIKGTKSLNELEIEQMCAIIKKINPDEVYIDAIESHTENFKEKVINSLKKIGVEHIPNIIAKNKADAEFKVVGAASILAKVSRDEALDKYRVIYNEFGEIGSGYTSDTVTIDFLKRYISKNKSLPPIARKSWSTSTNLLNEMINQKKLTDFF